MKRKAVLLILAILISIKAITGLIAQTEVSVTFDVQNVYWGTYNNPTKPAPGDQNVPLTIIIKQQSDLYLRGVYGYLYLNYTNNLMLDHVDRDNVSYTGAERIDTEPDVNDIVPYGRFYFTFYLDISSNITKGEYTVTLKIEYTAKNDSGFYQGIPQEINITVQFPNQSPVIVSTSPEETSVTLYVGDSQTFSIRAYDPDNDSISYTWRLDGSIVATGVTNYTYTATEDDLGSHTLVAELYDGEDVTKHTWTVSVQVNRITSIRASTDYIIGGAKTPVNVTITNNVWKGTVTVDLSYPDYVTIIGNTSWKFTNIKPGDSVNLSFIVYAPVKVVAGVYGEIELIGQTATLTFDISYTDYLGQSYQESIDRGFVIRGKQIVRVFNLKVTPNPAQPGDTIKVSAIILNTGTYKALYGNFSIYSDILILGYESFYYIGDIDTNAPLPVDVSAYIAPNVTKGIYNITVTLYYQDDQYNEYTQQFILQLNVTKMEEQTSEESQKYEEAVTIAYIFGTFIAVISLLYYFGIRRRRKKVEEKL